MPIWYLLPVQKLVAATQEPFVQAILDLGVPQMTFDGSAGWDAAFIPRPHCRQYVPANAIALADALIQYNHDVRKALPAGASTRLRKTTHSIRSAAIALVQLRNRSGGDTCGKVNQ